MAEVWELDLPMNEKMIALAFADCSNDQAICYPSLARIAWKCGVSRETAKRICRKFRDFGFLEAIRTGSGRGNATLYKLHPEKGVRLPDFVPLNGVTHNPVSKEKGSAPSVKGVTEPVKGVTAMTHESNTRIETLEPKDRATAATKKGSRFIPPTEQEVFEYMTSKGVLNAKAEAHKFFDHHANRKWRFRDGRGAVMDDWRKAVTTWEGNILRFGGKGSGETERARRNREISERAFAANAS